MNERPIHAWRSGHRTHWTALNQILGRPPPLAPILASRLLQRTQRPANSWPGPARRPPPPTRSAACTTLRTADVTPDIPQHHLAAAPIASTLLLPPSSPVYPEPNGALCDRRIGPRACLFATRRPRESQQQQQQQQPRPAAPTQQPVLPSTSVCQQPTDRRSIRIISNSSRMSLAPARP